MRVTNEEWDRVEKALSGAYGYVKLMIDGFEATVRIERYTALRLVILVYVNGKVKGEWIANDCEERRRFYCRHERSLLTAKQKAILKKQSKAYRENFESKYKSKCEYFEPYWRSFKSMKAHFIKNNESIEIVEIVGD